MTSRVTRGTLAVFVAAVALAGTACGTKTSMTQVWSAPVQVGAHPMRKIVVVATRMDEANRRSLEDVLVNGLTARGVEATQGYKLFPESSPDLDKAKAAVQATDADGILAADFKALREKVTYVPGAYTGGFWDGYYGWGYGYGYDTGYLRTDEIVNLETTLWDTRAGDKVVWSALTNTTNPSSGNAFVKSVGEAVLPSIAKAGFIPRKPKE